MTFFSREWTLSRKLSAMASNATLPVQYQMKAEIQDTMIRSIATYQQEGRFTDLKLVTNGQTIECHKVVVCSVSPYLASVAGNDPIELNDISYEILLQLVKYMYGAKQSTEWDTLKAAISACTKLQLADLKEELGSYAEQNVSANDCIGWWKFADAQGLENVATRARFLMLINLEEVKGSSEFKELPFEELVAYVTHDEVVLPNRDTMLVACIEWVDYEPAARRCHVLELFKRVELQLCGIEVLDIITTKYSDLVSDPDVTREIQKAVIPMMKKHSKMETRSILYCEFDNKNFKFYKSDIMIHNWKLLTTLTRRNKNNASIVTLPNGFAVLSLDHSHTNSLYDAFRKSWSDFPHPPRKITNAPKAISVYCYNCIYIFGGCDMEYSSVNIKINLDTLSWSEAPPIPTHIKKQPRTVSTGNHIYVVTSKALYHFNCKTQKWRSLTGPTTDGHILVTDNKHLYLAGGQFVHPEVYTISEDRWGRLDDRVDHNYEMLQRGGMFSNEMIVGFCLNSFSFCVYHIFEKTWSTIEWKGKVILADASYTGYSRKHYHRASSDKGEAVMMTMVEF